MRAVLAALLSATVAGPAAAADCNVTAEAPWTQAGWRIEAMTIGPSCGRAVVVLVIRDEQDVPLWIDTLTTMNLELLGLADTPQDMKATLASWVDYGGSDLVLASFLPEWAEGADGPARDGEIVLEAEPGLDRIDWEALRSRDAPIYCYFKETGRSTCLVQEPVVKNVVRIGRRIYPDPDGE